jgi:hypothetical protein
MEMHVLRRRIRKSLRSRRRLRNRKEKRRGNNQTQAV